MRPIQTHSFEGEVLSKDGHGLEGVLDFLYIYPYSMIDPSSPLKKSMSVLWFFPSLPKKDIFSCQNIRNIKQENIFVL
jgi:hypothetical protein